MLILDTHVWIWLLMGDESIVKSGLLPLINKSLSRSDVTISDISLWETAMLAQRNRITFSGNILEWIKNSLNAPGITVSPITPEIAVESNQLPGNFHGDPADRIITATARILSATLLSFDKMILEYSKQGHIKAINRLKQ